MSSYRFLHYDVFTRDRFAGNQLAVFVEGRGLGTATMQAIANEMAFSETTFVLPAEAAGDVRLRIFTPADELPMAGHPTVGTTFALAREGVIAAGRDRFVFELGVGPTPVSLEWDGPALTFAWMTQQTPVFGAVVSKLAALAAGLGLEPADIAPDGRPCQVVSCGVPFLFVPCANRDAVDRATSDRTRLGTFFAAETMAAVPTFLFSTEPGGDGARAYSRMFAPTFGIPEDPATGGASGPLGCYLVQYGMVTATDAAHIVSRQGVKMGRPSEIHIDIGGGPGRIDRVRVGGASVFVAEGLLTVE